jgi:hypothetical protein
MARMSMGSRPLFQQVVEAVALAADHQHGLHGLAGRVQAAAHGVRLGEGGQGALEGLAVGTGGAGQRELHAHEEQARAVVVVLSGFLDVAAMLQQKARDGVHQPEPVGAGQSQDVRMGHMPRLSQPGVRY